MELDIFKANTAVSVNRYAILYILLLNDS